MSGHGHGHSHNCGGGHDHDHSSEAELAANYSLYLKIDTERVQCLNETDEGSGKDVFKPWDRRLDKEKVMIKVGLPQTGARIWVGSNYSATKKFVESDADEELLFNIPFTGSVKLKGIILIGGEDDTHPNKMRLFKNRPGMTFDDASSKADEEFELSRDPAGVVEYRVKVARFNSVEHLSMHFPSNLGADNTKIYYIGLKGDFMEAHRHEVTICTYEANANPADHKTNLLDQARSMIS